MDIKKTFIRLTNYTCPHGQEAQYLRYLPKDLLMDEFGNYFLKIGESRSIFTCHLDTVSSKRMKVNHKFDGKFIRTDGTTILGADDKAGLTVLLFMIHNKVPGTYYFFIGEEVGCIGSGKASKKVNYFNKTNFDRMISFDRRDTHSVITFQSSQRCCSDAFADALSTQYNRHGMNMRKDDTGVYTDSAEFVGTLPECTNISVGYYSEHTSNERQDIEHLNKLCNASILVDWESLPTRRNPAIKEYKQYGWGGMYGGSDGYYEHDGYGQWPSRSNNWGQRPSDNKNTMGPRRLDTSFYNDDYTEYEDYYDPTKDYAIEKIPSSLQRNHEWLDEVEENLGTTYREGAHGLTIFDRKKNDQNWFDNIKDKYLDDRLSDEEISILKTQVLDMNDPDDIDFIKELEALQFTKNHNGL